MATKSLPSADRKSVEPKGASTPNPKAIREAAEHFARVYAREVPRIELLKKLGLAR